MTKYLFVLLFVFASQVKAIACDACGCSIMGQPTGLLSTYRKSFLSLGWSQAGFSSSPGIGEGTVDAFHTMDLSFDYYFTDRLRAGLYLPFRLNTRTIQDQTTSIHGFADTRMDVTYTFFKHNKSSSPWEIYLDGGVGLIVPTGKYDASLHDQNLPENFNPGNGSFGMSLQQTSGFSFNDLGMVVKNSFTTYASTKLGYQYGSQWATNLLVLAEIPIDSSLSIIPLGSVQFEKVWSDVYANGNEVHGTGGTGIFFSPGCQLKVRSWLCTFQYAIPLAHEYSDGEVIAGNRFSLQLTHLF